MHQSSKRRHAIFIADSDQLLVARKDESEDLATTARTIANWHIFGHTPTWTLHARNGEGVLNQKSQQTERPEYFDPLALGLVFPGEFRRGDSWRKVTNNYLAWPTGPRGEPLKDAMLRYTDGDFLVEIDAQRSYWPLKMTKRWNSLGERVFTTEFKLSQEHGHWLPQTATVKQPEMESRMTFRWASLNKTVASRFDVPKLQERYAISLRDQR